MRAQKLVACARPVKGEQRIAGRQLIVWGTHTVRDVVYQKIPVDICIDCRDGWHPMQKSDVCDILCNGVLYGYRLSARSFCHYIARFR